MSLLGCCLRTWPPKTSPRGPSCSMMLLRWSLSRRFWERRCPGQWGGLFFGSVLQLESWFPINMSLIFPYIHLLFIQIQLSVYIPYIQLNNITRGGHEPNTQAHHLQLRWFQTLSVSWSPSTTKWLRFMTCWRQLVARKTHHPWSVTTWNSSDWCMFESFKLQRSSKFQVQETSSYTWSSCTKVLDSKVAKTYIDDIDFFVHEWSLHPRLYHGDLVTFLPAQCFKDLAGSQSHREEAWGFLQGFGFLHDGHQDGWVG